MEDLVKENISSAPFLGRECPRSPSSVSPASSRRDSFRATNQGGDLESPTTTSPLSSSMQKRAISTSIDAATQPGLGDLTLTSPSNISAVSAGEKVCLCQPDPKIPRPRNAFILYRQHYQAQVVALHPGLANPEISKIIGEQWISQPPEVKNEWKKLAEEEKIRHQRQYPDYRYQPRRAGTASHTRKISSAEGPTRCPKCNGRYILTPRTPSTPSTPGLRVQNDRSLPPFGSQATLSQTITLEDRVQFPAGAINTSRANPSHSKPRWRPSSRQQNHAAVEMNPPWERRMSADISRSPDFKRRRFNPEPQSNPSPFPYDSANYKSSRQPMSAPGYSDCRRTQLAPGPMLQHSKGGIMDPPPRPSPATHQFSNMSLNSPYEESLRLPPLQTQGKNFGPGSSHLNSNQRADSQARSVEAMVMTIPYLNKIRVLSKISPPLAPPGPTSPVQTVRGAVIAVEGADYKLVAEVGSFIREHLSKDHECIVKTWSTSLEALEQPSAPKVEISDIDQPAPPSAVTTISAPSTQPSLPPSPYLGYLHTIQTWHSHSRAIIDFITTSPVPSSSSSSSNPPIAPPSQPESTTTSPLSLSPLSTLPPPPIHPTPAPKPPQTLLPVALLPTGFSLTLSDAFASHIPITDAYAPIDHWQWMATLWRGIVGADLTIYVRRVGPEQPADHGSRATTMSTVEIEAGAEAEAAAQAEVKAHEEAEAQEEIRRYGAVECKWGMGVVVVRVAGTARGEPRVEQKTLRRLGFEVLEWLRSGGGAGRTGFVRGDN